MVAVLSMSSIAPYGGDSLASETQTEIETESEIMTDTERETESIGETAPETEAPILETEALYRRRKHLGDTENQETSEDSPQTGDNTPVTLWLMILLVSGVIFLTSILGRNRK